MSSPPPTQVIGVSHKEDSPKRALTTVLNVLQSALTIFAPSFFTLVCCPADQPPYTESPGLPSFSFSFFFIEVQLIKDILLISGMQHSDSIFFYRLCPISSYYKIMAIFSCAVQYILVLYLFNTQQFVPLFPLPLYLSSLLVTTNSFFFNP